jgi:pimeloyl-ACP methyl ester carboxylesterase
MNHHELIDNLAVQLSALGLGRYKFFSASIASPRIVDHLESTKLHLPRIEGPGVYEVSAGTLVGRLKPAFCIVQWLGEEYTTILWHHGNAERPFEFRWFSHTSFKQIFLRAKEPLAANVVALAAPFHRRSLISYAEQLRDLAKFVAMLAVSTTLVEALISYLKARTDSRVMVAGISLGGWVTNLHRAFYNTADLYVPLLAGAALDEVFTGSLYRNLTGRLARENPGQLKEVLNFEPEFTRIKDNNVFPLLARHDQIIRFERHRTCYGNRPITLLEKGHITASLAHYALREHLLGQLARRKTP